MPSAYLCWISLAEIKISRVWAAVTAVATSLEASSAKELCEDAEEKHVWAQRGHWHILQHLEAICFAEAPAMQICGCSELANEAEKTSSLNGEKDTLYNQHWFILGSVDMRELGMLTTAVFFEWMGQSLSLSAALKVLMLQVQMHIDFAYSSSENSVINWHIGAWVYRIIPMLIYM